MRITTEQCIISVETEGTYLSNAGQFVRVAVLLQINTTSINTSWPCHEWFNIYSFVTTK